MNQQYESAQRLTQHFSKIQFSYTVYFKDTLSRAL